MEIGHTHVKVVGLLGSTSNLASFWGLYVYIAGFTWKPEADEERNTWRVNVERSGSCLHLNLEILLPEIYQGRSLDFGVSVSESFQFPPSNVRTSMGRSPQGVFNQLHAFLFGFLEFKFLFQCILASQIFGTRSLSRIVIAALQSLCHHRAYLELFIS